MLTNSEALKKEIAIRQAIVLEELGLHVTGLIASIAIGDNKKVIEIKNSLLTCNYSVGAIRQPTVASPIIRLIARLGESSESLRDVCKKLSGML